MRGLSQALAVVCALALSACAADSPASGPMTRLVVEANGADLAKHAQSGGSGDAIMAKSMKVIEGRLKASGSVDPILKRDGQSRITVQTNSLKEGTNFNGVIGRRGVLEFRIIDDQADPAETAKGKARPDSEVLPMADGSGLVAVKKDGGIRDAVLAKSTQAFNRYTNSPNVDINLNAETSQKFAALTAENVRKSLAFVVDGQVLTVPMILEPILGGQMQLDGNFTVEMANELAIILGSGSLPVGFRVVDQRKGE